MRCCCLYCTPSSRLTSRLCWNALPGRPDLLAFRAGGQRTMNGDLIELVQNLGQPRVLVVGDVMLDRYVWGDAERISQEAPVVLLHADRREERLGGARLRQLLTDLGIDHEGVVTDPGRPTTVKERYIGRAQHRHPQQMISVDYEVRTPIAGAVEMQLCQISTQQMRKA